MNNKFMKKVSLFLIFVLSLNILLPSSVSLAETKKTETFDNLGLTGSSYVDGSFVGVDGITWTYTGARNQDTFGIDGTGIMFRDPGKAVESSAISGGISSISVDLKKAFTSTADRQVEVFINGQSIGKSEAFSDDAVHTFTVNNLNVAGPFTIKVANAATKQVVVDNISWTSNEAGATKTAGVEASVAPGAVAAGTEVALTSATADSTIYYTTDGSAPSKTSSTYSAPITINENTTIKAFAAAAGLEDSEIASFEYTILSAKSIAEVRAMQQGTNVMTTGIVTAVLGSATYIQDETAGIVLYGANLGVNPGDRVQASGELTEYSSLLEINVKPSDVKVLSTKEVPAAAEVKAADFNEGIESTLVTLTDVSVESFSGGNYTATDADGDTFQIRPSDSSLLAVNTTYDSITGVLSAYNNAFQLIPRNAGDIILDSSKVQAVVANPASGLVNEGDTVTLATGTEGAAIYYSTDGSNPDENSTVYSGPITISEATTIKAVAVKSGMTDSDVAVFNYAIQKDEIRIHDIQGEGHYSLYQDSNVNNIEGIVTKVVDARNFYMQDPQPDDNDKTAEGILVYRSNHGLTVGNKVKVSGTVKEYVLDGYAEKAQTDLPVTEISASAIEVTEAEAELPAPVILGVDRQIPTEIIDNDGFAEFDPEEDGIDFWESLEGMLVEVNNPKVVAPQKYGELVVVPGSYETNTDNGGLRITKEDMNPERVTLLIDDESFVAKMGDHFNGSVQGVVSYGFSNFKVLTDKNNLPEFVEADIERETTSLTKEEDKLTIASYNVENFSPAVSADKIERLARAVVENLKQPDIIGLTEVQDSNGETNDGTTDATESFKVLVAKIKELGGPQYSYTDIAPVNNQDGGAPGGNIRVGFLYNADRVSLTEGAPKGTSTQSVGFENGKLTLNPGRIDPTNEAYKSSRKPLAAQFDFNGESVIVVANHFNSKGGDQPLFGKVQPPVLGSEVQRMKIAKIVNGFVKDVKAEDPNANIVLLGDFNDFEFSNPLKALKGQELTNMIEQVPAEERYSYSYQGNAQVLDHILVSNNLAAATAVDIVHINSGFMEEHGRASDHDPVLIQTALQPKAEPVYDKVYNLSGFSTKKLTVSAHNSLVNMDASSVIREGIVLKTSVTLKGAGLKTTKVIISPAQSGAIIDLSGAEVQEVVIDNSNVKEIRGAENVQKWTVTDGVDTSNIKFTNVKGEAIASPFLPVENGAPAARAISNQTVQKNDSLTIELSNYFTDPDGDELTYTSTRGNVFGSTLTFHESEEGTYEVTVKAIDGDKEAQLTFQLTVTGEQTEQPVDSYYTAAAGKTGSELKAALHDIIKTHKVLSYSQVWDALKETDEDPNNPNNVILLYSGISRSKDKNGGNVGDWNREHVWAKSHGDFGTTNGPGTDIHHLRPTDVQVNSTRGNLDFANGGSAVTNCSDCKRSANSFEPPDRVKGDVARMLFYMAVRYESGDRVDLELNDLLNNGSNPYHGKLSVLLEWNEQDPVDAFEMNRNNVIYSIQENRNPFIDHPEWANQIFRTAN